MTPKMYLGYILYIYGVMTLLHVPESFMGHPEDGAVIDSEI
jgi:hypothetical protein